MSQENRFQNQCHTGSAEWTGRPLAGMQGSWKGKQAIRGADGKVLATSSPQFRIRCLVTTIVDPPVMVVIRLPSLVRLPVSRLWKWMGGCADYCGVPIIMSAQSVSPLSLPFLEPEDFCQPGSAQCRICSTVPRTQTPCLSPLPRWLDAPFRSTK